MEFELDDLSRTSVHRLLEEHMEDMHKHSPPESIHALDLSKLKKPEISFWTLWDHTNKDLTLVGCCALKALSETEGEIKSMRTSNQHRGTGAGKRLLEFILDQAAQRQYKTLYLETGSMEFFEPARALYKKYGFEFCDPFADYVLDPNSNFMKLELVQ